MAEPLLRTGRAAALLFTGLLVLPVTAAPAAAQNPSAAPPSRQPGQPPGGSPIDVQIRQLHQLLRITPAQEPDFRAFAEAWRSRQETISALFQRRPPDVNTNALESLRFSQRLAAANATTLQRMIGPFARLYASFSPTQRQTANRLFLRQAPAPGRG